ncbi:MAG: hypothetical protein AAF503_04655 [Pseudomonadota bacterium]
MRIYGVLTGLAVATAFCAASAGDVEIVGAKATRSGETWRIDVTLLHGDTGWDHYADAWRVIGPDGTELGTRVLAHPHVDEQPFTRSLGGVRIPEGVTEVTIEAHDKVHGWSEQTYKLELE